MNADGIVYADERIQGLMGEDESLAQVANVAHLPGIVGSSLAMPDIHWGYGFPIGGVAAFDEERGGVVSPGGVGYDINCLGGDACVLAADGSTRSIEEIVRHQIREPVLLLAGDKRRRFESAAVSAGLSRSNEEGALEIETVCGRRIVATREHPFLTPDGMHAAGDLQVGGRVAVLPFDGIPREPSSSRTIVTEADLRAVAARFGKTNSGNGLEQALGSIRWLLPLKDDHPTFPVLLKVMGYVLGDGAIHVERARNRLKVTVNGAPEDLAQMARDLGVFVRTPRVYSRERHCKVTTSYGDRSFQTTESFIHINSGAFAMLLAAMGLPIGRRPSQDFTLPEWLMLAPRWQQRLFLAGFFGAELSSPRPVPDQGTCFFCPVLNQNKHERHVESGRELFGQVSRMLERFDVPTLKVHERLEQKNKDGSQSVRLSLVLSGRDTDLVSLWSRVGFEYNAKRSRLAAWAVGYLQAKIASRKAREDARQEILALREAHGWGATRIALAVAPRVNKRFVERTLYERAERKPRTALSYARYEEWLKEATLGLGDSGAIWQPIAAIRPRKNVRRVYDITVDHPAHDFVANGFIVHNCGVRLLQTNVPKERLEGKSKELAEVLFHAIPSGVGSSRKDFPIDEGKLKRVMTGGAPWLVEQGMGRERDLLHIEEGGKFAGAEPAQVSHRAFERGLGQLGTLGSGNHFVEVGWIDEVYDEETAKALGIALGNVSVIVHTGSRGFGHQIATDFIEVMNEAVKRYKIELPDRQLCCAPIGSPEGQAYLKAMSCAVNYAFANRQLITHWVRRAFTEILGRDDEELGLDVVYDVCHNIAKFEEHKVGNVTKRLCVHRKGATRAFPPGHPKTPQAYQKVGQPVLIPGDMGRYSYVLVGTEKAAEETWGSTCHGAGRVLSRGAAERKARGRNITAELAGHGIHVRAASRATVVEEMPEAYKDVLEVVNVVQGAGISRKVARHRPLAVIKG
jgi:tRNA-splicing ligase RtcB